MTSICGLGQVALGPVMSVLRMRTGGQEGEQAGEVGPTRTHERVSRPSTVDAQRIRRPISPAS